jgi:N-acetylmuramoyl-L-alanine amidase
MKKWIGCLYLAAAFLILPGCAPTERPPSITEEKPLVVPPAKPSTPTYKPPVPSVKVPTWGVKGKTIVVDAGHGGKDPGTLGNRYSTMPEKYINLSIANEVVDQLKAKGARVIMTRSSDRFIELEDRAAIAEKYHADLFVAIHTNASEKRSESGFTVYTSRSPSWSSRKAAYAINSAMTNAGFESNGVSQADYKVLVLHDRPAVLVECGYLTNYAECKRMNTASYRERIANSIVAGISGYFSK